MNIKVDPEWWKTLFDEVYLLTDARSVCDEEITRREVDLIFELLPILEGHRILDLCGGHGRHSLELCSRGDYQCTLLDYSQYLIDQARARASENHDRMDFIQADARQTGLPDGSFDHVIIMGNSLGYLPDPAADVKILSEANRVLSQGGWLLIDVADGAVVKGSFNPNAWHEIGEDIVVCRQREVQGDAMCAREMVLSKQNGVIRDCTYSIRLYEAGTIEALLEQAGFERVTILTDFSSHYCEGDYGFMNRRMIAWGQKASALSS
jgi:D-alanine-D-alanine ligase